MLNFIPSLYVDTTHSNERVPLSICPSMADSVSEKRVALDSWNTSAFVGTTYTETVTR